jgi:hypothetical protein
VEILRLLDMMIRKKEGREGKCNISWNKLTVDVYRFPNGGVGRDLVMPSHALLLRLFLSPSFFSVHVALRYLLLYADNIGITYYLTGRLRQLDIHELRDVWGFVW